ncbi:hypothetical protein P3X46_002881 [Hevea brasiliensis]|uniref:Uncharacterized protein n=1 Tax=Hevea brasiliensis TaxID=3981 RepID=A0ABQ9N666_HEVBR|nr:hypothetical protein P3X46_002881 [Hevea brasiliensis]
MIWAKADIVGNPAGGGLFSLCGWNSVIEAAWHGVRLLVWPPKGDHRVNATVIERKGLRLWPKTWEWSAETLVKGEEMGERIKEMKGSEELKLRAEQREVIDKWSNSSAKECEGSHP